MDRELRILILEDSAKDAQLMERELRRGGISLVARCAETRDAFVKQMEEFQPDIILSDYSMPSFDGLAALKLLRERSPQIPFVFVSGSIGEERAIEALKLGATDYVLKDRLLRLVPTVQRAMREVQEHAERRKLEEQYRQAQRMEAIGRLAGGVAHDFNNLLTAIMGYSQLARRELPAEAGGQAELEEVLKAAERAASLTGQLLAFSRQQVLEPKVLDLNAIVTGLDKMLRRLIGEDIDLVTAPAPDLGHIRADPGQIEQVIMNLVVNARDAMPEGGKLTVETANVGLDDEYASLRADLHPGRYAMLAVSDTGCGMTPEVKARMFEPFFSTKEQGKGTGLGLSMVHGIVKQSDGYLEVYSEPGQGTTFKIYLPLVEEDVERVTIQRAAMGPLDGTETVLVVEDEEPVRRVVGLSLRLRGYRVLEAADGSEAIAICDHGDPPVDLLVTDVVMTLMSGPELAQRVTRVCPSLRVLFISGYTDRALIHQGLRLPGTAFLQKPFTPETLARKVRELLDQPAARAA